MRRGTIRQTAHKARPCRAAGSDQEPDDSRTSAAVQPPSAVRESQIIETVETVETLHSVSQEQAEPTVLHHPQ